METLQMKELKKLNCEAMGRVTGGGDDNKPKPTKYKSTSTGWTVYDEERPKAEGGTEFVIIDMKP
ncbi:MAG: hypothetical protein NC048_02215 [Bacteroides sp.]|nr:hypothetical protein [Bacteroides sp.]